MPVCEEAREFGAGVVVNQGGRIIERHVVSADDNMASMMDAALATFTASDDGDGRAATAAADAETIAASDLMNAIADAADAAETAPMASVAGGAGLTSRQAWTLAMVDVVGYERLGEVLATFGRTWRQGVLATADAFANRVGLESGLSAATALDT